jgi:hypothetical protein
MPHCSATGSASASIPRTNNEYAGCPVMSQAGALLDLTFQPIQMAHYGQLVRSGQVVPWKPNE